MKTQGEENMDRGTRDTSVRDGKGSGGEMKTRGKNMDSVYER